MRKKVLNRKVNERGITLIALVITIIVLLILAGVTIATLTGDNGILNKAQKAKEETGTATDEEQRQLAMYEASMNLSGMTFQGVKIPAGFAPTRISGESTVDEGLVIIDSKGNEFVWIPCEYDSKTAEANGKKNENTVYYNDSAVESSKHDNRNEDWREHDWYYDGGTWYDGQPHSEEIMNSIKIHQGFYVARYEAGVPKEASFYVDPEGRGELKYNTKDGVRNDTNKIKNGEIIPVSQKGRQAWNYILQGNAKIAAGKMVENNPDVQSYLMDSHAWNTICRLIAEKDNSKDLTDSTVWGNYLDNTTTKYQKVKGLWAKNVHKGNIWELSETYFFSYLPEKESNSTDEKNLIEMATGICEDFKSYNIYDLAGNMWEMTTEVGKLNGNDHYSEAICNETDCEDLEIAPNTVVRGGSFGDGGSGRPVVCARGDFLRSYPDFATGFRVVLYLK